MADIRLYDLDVLIDMDRIIDLDYEFDFDGPFYPVFDYIFGIEGLNSEFCFSLSAEEMGVSLTAEEMSVNLEVSGC